jgi:RNA polymerase sigma-70 factor (ECF subfamily)
MPALLARLRRRDPASLEAIVDANARRLYRATRGMGFGPGEAEDLVQEVFVTFLDTLDRFEGRAEISTWLFGILHHKVQERRRIDARGDHDPIDEVFESRFDASGSWILPPVDPEREVASREAGTTIRHCLEELSPLQREVFQLREVEDLPALEVSNILGKTVTHIGVLLHRARMRLRECLTRKGWGSGS